MRCWTSRCRRCSWTARWSRRARDRFAAVPLAQRVYSRIRPSAAAQRLPPWRPSDALGPAGVPLFVRASGKPLTDGIPGFFTRRRLPQGAAAVARGAAKSVVSESWVLGKRVAFDPNGPQMQTLKRDVIALYEADYAPAWDLMLADLNVAPLRSLPQAAQDLYILASPQSPMRKLLAAISRQLTLSVPTGGAQPVPAAMPTPPASDCGSSAPAGTVRRAAARRRRAHRSRPAMRSMNATRRCASWSVAGQRTDRSGAARDRRNAAADCQAGGDTGQPAAPRRRRAAASIRRWR